jgi:hypothetical protein
VTTIRACSSHAPTPVKPQPAPAILSQQSVHTTLSITHHTRKRPSISPRTTHGPHTSGTCQFLGSSLVSWSSRKQSSVAQSTTEAEYVAAASCCSQLLWITYTMSDFGEEYTHVPLQCDSTSAMSIEKNPMIHSKTKNIEVRYHFLRDSVEKGKIALIHVPTHDQIADIFTKPLDQATFTRL